MVEAESVIINTICEAYFTMDDGCAIAIQGQKGNAGRFRVFVPKGFSVQCPHGYAYTTSGDVEVKSLI